MFNDFIFNGIFAMLKGGYLDHLNVSGNNIPDIFGLVMDPLTEVIPQAVLYSWVVFMTFSMLYLKGQRVEIPAIISIIFGAAALRYLPPDVHGVAILLMALATTSLIVRAFRSRD
jgi:hypothetical protein